MRMAALCLVLAVSGSVAAQASRPGAASASSQVLRELAAGSLVALLPPAGGERQKKHAATSDEVVQTVGDVLRRRGLRVLMPNQVRQRLQGHTPDACSNPATCDTELALATLHADAVISIAVWQDSGADTQVVVHVRRQHGYGQAEVTVHSAHKNDLHEAATDALLQALDDSRRMHEVAVRVESTPSGASLSVDQSLHARTPATLSLLPGSHLLTLEAPGFVNHAQYVDVPADLRTQVAFHLQLTAAAEPKQASAPPARDAPTSKPAAAAARPGPVRLSAAVMRPAEQPAQPEATRASSLNYVVAAALLGVALPLLANAVYAFSTRGDCVGTRDALDSCGRRIVLGPIFYVSLIAGSAAAAGAAGFMIGLPLQSEVEPSRPAPGAQLQWRHKF